MLLLLTLMLLLIVDHHHRKHGIRCDLTLLEGFITLEELLSAMHYELFCRGNRRLEFNKLLES